MNAEGAIVTVLLVFAAGMGVLATVGVVLVLLQLAAETAGAIAAAGIGAGVSIPLAIHRRTK